MTVHKHEVVAVGADQTRFCPTCGRENPISYSPEWLLTKFTGLSASLLMALMQARRDRTTMSMRGIINYMQEVDPSWMNTEKEGKVRELIGQVNKHLVDMGWMIVGPRTTGAGYMLVRLE
jgi:hypothetical protein